MSLEIQSTRTISGGFHMGKCLEHCIGKNIGKNKGTGLEDGLIECKLIW